MIHRVELSGWKCDQCNHAWLADERPKRCSNHSCRALADSVKHSKPGRPIVKLAILVLLVLSAKSYAQFPDAPSAVVDRNFLILTSFNAASTIGDAATTLALVGHGQCPYEVWSAPLYGRQPQIARTTLVMGGLFAASVITSYELKKHNSHIWKLKLWAIPQTYMAYGHASGMIHNLRNCR